ncbi:MAG TPA: hypothetical protein VMI92_07140 [Steroidobacteraceae bacterium]|nr:hypothetical protein [Steroidobacteraceae bacterium]
MIKPGRKDAAARAAAMLASALLVLQAPLAALAGPREQAKRLHDRIAGVPPSDSVLTAMAAKIQSGDTAGAAAMATDNPNFYNVTLKNFVAPWTNRAMTVFVPLNDYTATVIGMIRDDVDFRQVLTGDILYTSNASGAPGYSPANNDHYQYLDDNNVDLKSTLVQTTQSSLLGIPPEATAGVITTRSAAEAFFIAGTNRAMFRFTLINYMCRDMNQVLDITRAPDRIRQDVSRSPGGDSRVFLNNCIGCHSGMDPMAQAFAYYNFNATTGRLEYTAGTVQPKYLINSDNFKAGYVTTSDAWENRWRAGQNSLMGFDAAMPATGNGAKSLGAEFANSDAFAECQVEKVFKAVCLRDPSNDADRAEVATMTASFKSDYKMKKVFADAGVYCMGQ